MGSLKGTLRAISFLALTLPLMPLQFVFTVLWPTMAQRFPQIYHCILSRLLGIRIDVDCNDPIIGPCLIVTNHVSWLDIVILSTLTPLSFVAKRQVAGWPLFGWLARLQRTVFIDRERRVSTHEHGDELQSRLQAGETLVLFPEGTSGDGTSVMPFKSSFFAAARAPGIVIRPLTLAYSHCWGLPITRRTRPHVAWYGDMELLPHLWAVLCGGPITVKLVVHDAMSIATGLDRKQAARVAENTVRQGLWQVLHAKPNLR